MGPALRKRNKRCNGRATARVAPTKALQGVRRGERNPPVTALPCQPPLGKGALGTGDADCHSQCAHWLRNDTIFYKGCDVRRDTWVPPYGSVTRGAMGGRPQGSPLRKRYKGCRGERNPPVTAASCQPPLGEGALGTGGTDVPVAVPKISTLPYGGRWKF